MRKISRMGQIFIILLIRILYYVLFYSFGVKRPFPSFYEMLVLIMLIFSVCNFKTDNTWKIKIGNSKKNKNKDQCMAKKKKKKRTPLKNIHHKKQNTIIVQLKQLLYFQMAVFT